jgi:hypothetical protein
VAGRHRLPRRGDRAPEPDVNTRQPDDEPVQQPMALSSLAELEAFAAAMRAAGAEDGSVVGADIAPSMGRRNAGFITRLWGHPRAIRSATPAPGEEPPRWTSLPSDGDTAARP